VPVKRTLSILAVVTITACAAPPPDAQEPRRSEEGTQTAPTAPTAAATLSQRCTNAQFGISVAYPEGWHTNDGSVTACTVFHPAPIELPRNSEIPFELAVVLRVEKEPVDQLTRSSQWERVLSSTQTTIGGRKAFRVEVEATGEGLADRGLRSLRYVVDLGGGRSLVATTHAVNESYEQNKEVLRRMVESVTVG
jgi:hypothetical protein